MNITKDFAINYVQVLLNNPQTNAAIHRLNEYDFKPFLPEGMSIYVIMDNIEKAFDYHCKNNYGKYLFDDLNVYDVMMYFMTRYNVRFQQFNDWVVRKIDSDT